MRILYRKMDTDEVDRIVEINRAEVIRTGFAFRDGQLHELEVTWNSPNWTENPDLEHSFRSQIDFCRDHLSRGGLMFGAFADGRLAGIGLIQPEVRPGMAQLAFLHVSDGHRQAGIGSEILDALTVEAQNRGARSMYVSATPSGSAVGFYLKHGFSPTTVPIAELYEREPEDIHMIRQLS
jgi:ribosomal protein S18 acetylase RimI-like enzyme